MNLLEMGMIEVVGLQTPSLIKKVRMINFRETFTYAYYGAFLVLIFSFLVYFKPDFLNLFLDSKIEESGIEAPAHFIHKAQMQRIKDALEIYYLEKGDYPASLDDLTMAGLLQKNDLFFRKGTPYKYESKNGKYFLKH
jgi:competence protein ComGC